MFRSLNLHTDIETMWGSSTGVGTGVADFHGLALQELQLTAQITLRPCPLCGQNAKLQVMRCVHVL